MSNLAQRILTAVVTIPIIIFLCIQGGIFFLAFVLLIASVSLWEFYGLAQLKGIFPQRAAGIVTGVCIVLSFYHHDLQNGVAGFFSSMGIAVPFPSQSQLFMVVLLAGLLAASLSE